MNNLLNDFYLEDFYRLASSFVQNYPQGKEKCTSPQTFAVLDYFSDLDAPNLNKTLSERNKPFFWSRAWAKTNYNPSKLTMEYPLLAMFETNFVPSGLFEKTTSRCYKIKLAMLDRLDKDCLDKKKQCKGCKGRVANELFIDTELMMLNFFAFLRQVEYVFAEDADLSGWYHKDVWPLLGITGEADTIKSRKLQRMFAENNKTNNGYRWMGGNANLHGTVIDIQVCVNTCQQYIFNPTSKTFKVGYDRSY